MQILKTFIDSTGHRHKVGADVPKEWDKATLAHYRHHGMIGDAQDAAKPQTKPRKQVGPAEKKPAAPSATQSAGVNTNQAAVGTAADTTDTAASDNSSGPVAS